jgi:hypothetical protein
MRKTLVVTLGIALLSTIARGDPGRVEIMRFATSDVGVPIADCGTFMVLNDATYDWMVKLVDGVLVANHIRVSDARHYNSNDPTISVDAVPGEVQNNVHIDTETGNFTAAAPIFKVVVPGEGPIFMETGFFAANMYTLELSRSTGWNDYADGNYAALCDYLASAQ